MSLSIEIPKDSNAYHDYKCKKCGRKIRFTSLFFKKGFEFPLNLKCAECKEPFIVDLKITECNVSNELKGRRPGKKSRKLPPD